MPESFTREPSRLYWNAKANLAVVHSKHDEYFAQSRKQNSPVHSVYLPWAYI